MIAQEVGIVSGGVLLPFLYSKVSAGVLSEVSWLGIIGCGVWPEAGHLFAASTVVPQHSALATTLWSEHDSSIDADERVVERGEGAFNPP